MSQTLFAPAPGLFTDTSSFSGNGGWIDGSNVRFWNGRWQTIGGWSRRGSLAISSTANAVHQWIVSAGTSYNVWGGDTSLQVETGGSLFDIKPSGTLGTLKWSFANYGDTLIANISGAKIYQWSLNTGVAAVQVTNAPTQTTCILVTEQRQLLAFGCNEELSGTFNGRCIRGSDLEDITDWTTSSTNNAFEHILDGANTAIVTARIVGPYVAVWTSTELWMGQFIGDPSQTYRFERVGANCGIVSQNAVCTDGGTAYWLTPDLVFMSWAPGSDPVEIACPIINFLRGDWPTSATNIAATFACHVSKFNEVWFLYANSGQYAGRYVAFSLTDGHWSKGRTERRVMFQGPTGLVSGLIGALNNGNLINCETGLQGLGGSTSAGQLIWNITSSDIYVDSGQRRVMIRSLRTDFSEQSGDVTITARVKNYPNESYQTKTLTSTVSTKKLDFRKSGRLVSITFSGTDAGALDTFARQGEPVLDVVPTGER